MERTLTLHNISLSENREIAPGLYAARDSSGCLRTHNGTDFRGYVLNSFNRKQETRFGVHCWNGRTRLEQDTRWKTRYGAEAALVRETIRLHKS